MNRLQDGGFLACTSSLPCSVAINTLEETKLTSFKSVNSTIIHCGLCYKEMSKKARILVFVM